MPHLVMSKQCTLAEEHNNHELDVSDNLLDTAWLHSPGTNDDGILSSAQSLKMSDDVEENHEEEDDEQQKKRIIHRLII